MVTHEPVNGGSPEVLARKALRGDQDAREELVRAIKDQVYGLALRMLADPAEAEDATQEILIKVITRLNSFRGESRFTTWVYAVAANHLRTMHARRRRRRWSSFEQILDLQESLLPVVAPVAERAVLTRELWLFYLHGLLICLDRDHRLAFVLGGLLELSSAEAAQVLGIRASTYRKRLSRARQRMRDFTLRHGELVRPENSCRCELCAGPAVAAGGVNPGNPKLAGHPASDNPCEDLEERMEGLDELKRIKLLFRSLPEYRTPDTVVDELTRLIKAEDATSLAREADVAFG